MAVRQGVAHFQKILDLLSKEGSFDRVCEKVKLVSIGNGNLSAIMKVEQEHVNRGANLHGGLSCTLVDCLSSLALMSHPNYTSPGVSIALNVSFMRSVPSGQEILIKASTNKLGKKVAFLTVDILSRSSGELVAQGTHTKYIG